MRQALLVAALLTATLLAGCSDPSGSGAADGGGAATMTTTTTGPPPKPAVTTDTLHLLAAPEMGLAPPDGSSDIETGTAGNFGPGSGGRDNGPPSQWQYVAKANSNVTAAEIHVWINVKEQLIQPPNLDPRTPGQPPCTWYVRLSLGSDAEPVTHCLSESPGPIPTGTKELVFNLDALDAELETNETVSFLFGRQVFSASQEDAVAVLSGTSDHDSRLVLKGLKEIVPGA